MEMASKGYNHVVLVGNLGRDPELRTTPKGSSVCNFTLATAEKYKNKAGELVETTDWHKIELWDALADIASKWLKKGNLILIEGKIKNDNYEKDGVKHYGYKILASNLTMLGSKSEGSLDRKNDMDNSNLDSKNDMDNSNLDSTSSDDDDSDIPF
jgi:single-strand DNA-binding protein